MGPAMPPYSTRVCFWNSKFYGNTCRLVETFNTMRAPLRSSIEPPRRMRHTQDWENNDDQNDRRSLP